MEQIKPCPFCGSYEITIDPVDGAWKSNVVDGTDAFLYSASCTECESEGPSADTEQGAIDLWNSRKA